MNNRTSVSDRFHMRKTLQLLCMVLMFSLLFCIPASAKSFVIGGKISEKKGTYNFRYFCDLNLNAGVKTGKTAPTVSAQVLLPQALLASKNEIYVNCNLNVHDYSKINQDSFLGTSPSIYIFKIKCKSGGKFSLQCFEGKTGKKKSLGQKLSLEKYGDDYLLSIKDSPCENFYFPKDKDWDEKNKVEFDPQMTYMPGATIIIEVNDKKLSKKVDSYIYLKSLSINLAEQVNLDIANWNFQWLDFGREDQSGYKNIPKRIGFL